MAPSGAYYACSKCTANSIRLQQIPKGIAGCNRIPAYAFWCTLQA